MGPSVDISVIVCTRNRALELERTLSTLQEQRIDGAFSSEIIVINNGSTDHTRMVLGQNWDKIKVTSVDEPQAGKSRALNRGLEMARGELIAFTDDDVSAAQVWLAELHAGGRTFPSAGLFCGPIVPLFPAQTPEWFGSHPLITGFFGKFNPSTKVGPLPPDAAPLGANFAAARQILENMKFRVDLGPSPENGQLMGEDTEFIARLRERSPECVYLPEATVFHRISPSQIHESWILERAFQLGRTRMVLYRQPDIHRKQKTLRVEDPEQSKVIQRMELGGLLNYYCGQLSECEAGEFVQREQLESALQAADPAGTLDLFGVSALKIWKACDPVPRRRA